MQQSIKNTTNQLLTSLPQEHVYYTPSDFEKAGFPAYLVDRIRIELDRNLAESISIPKSDWVDMGADGVQHAWDQFLCAIRAEARVPGNVTRDLIEATLEDVLDLLTQPRNYILDVLVGSTQASLTQIEARKDWIVVYNVLVDALIRYMQRKNLEVISREKALQVIAHVDDKLAENYTPLKWAQHLEPVFTLLDNEVPSSLMIRYFTDRDMHDFAKWLGKGPDLLSRSSFIERISTVGILHDDDEIDTPVPTTAPILAHSVQQDEEAPFEIETKPETTATATTDQELIAEESVDSETEIEIPEESNPLYVTLDEVLEEEQPAEEPLFSKFVEDTSEEEPAEASDEDLHEEKESILNLTHQDVFGTIDSEEGSESLTSFDEDEREQEVESDLESDKAVEETTTDIEETGDDDVRVLSIAERFSMQDEEEATPIAMMPFDQPADEIEKEEPADEPLEEPEDTTPIIDASSDDEHVIYLTRRAKKLLDLLEPNLETFIVDIFLNDELEFYKHLENITAYDQWRTAGRYITRDIFDRNRIDLYSESAVLFTDAVQEYFDQNA